MTEEKNHFNKRFSTLTVMYHNTPIFGVSKTCKTAQVDKIVDWDIPCSRLITFPYIYIVLLCLTFE